jgi:hypothetical protein
VGDFYTTFRGRACCDCTARWLPLLEDLAVQRGIIPGDVKILQLRGSNPASAGTHAGGGAIDFGYYSGDQARDLVALARDMGADATWYRPWDGNHHVHAVLRGCPLNQGARYQIAAVDDGYNGLGSDGRDGPDDGPRPLSYRTFEQGITYAQGELDMPLTDDDVDRIAGRVWSHPIGDVSTGTVLVRVNPGPVGFPGAVRDAVWEHTLQDVWGNPVSAPNLLRYTHGEATAAHTSADKAAENTAPSSSSATAHTSAWAIQLAAAVGVLCLLLGSALTLAIVAGVR